MARAHSKKAVQQGTKRKRADADDVASEVLARRAPDEDEASASNSSEQSEEPLLDCFAEDVAEPIEAFHDAVTEATAFLQPSEQLSSLARSAAKVCQ